MIVIKSVFIIIAKSHKNKQDYLKGKQHSKYIVKSSNAKNNDNSEIDIKIKNKSSGFKLLEGTVGKNSCTALEMQNVN